MMKRTNTVSLSMAGMMLVAVSACSQRPVAAAPSLAEVPSVHERADRQARVPNEYLVTLAAGMDESAIREIFGRLGIQEVNVLGGETYLLILKIDPGPGAMEDMVRGDTRFVAVQPNLIYWANRSRKGAQ